MAVAPEEVFTFPVGNLLKCGRKLKKLKYKTQGISHLKI